MELKNYLDIVNVFITNNMENLLLGVIILSIITLIVFINVNIKLSKIVKKYKDLTRGMDGSNIEDILLHQTDYLKDLDNEVSDIKQAIAQLTQDNRQMIKKVYWKRYNAFPEMGSDLSFSLALLNEGNSGVVITSIYGRDENRVYLKPIVEGKSNYTLSPEEREIILEAIQTKII
ncbi:MAG: DUF4446 family protein [Tepidanaerobacter acetatoxydans]|uniref:DUF4446 family protein n=1 Tax=Tepidanaerobacter TaxID=499228 RepID=UPI000ADF519F|nr:MULTISPECIES: DUF4446 family protein [Tepidanaerobacter]NLU10415.1 DUF4446 family protein [Tepidanaerobacter acetatoxydans]